MKTRVFTIICPNCKDEIYSRARHDMIACSCSAVAVDGGFDYNRVCYKSEPPKTRVRYIQASREEMYNDWKQNINKYGIYKKTSKKH